MAGPFISAKLRLDVAEGEHLPQFKKALQRAFSMALASELGTATETIPADEDVERSFHAEGSVILRILVDDEWVGGAIVTIAGVSHENELAFFYIEPGEHGRGIGQKAWSEIERRYPETRKWTTHTPYFEKRNIHFYVNKCRFKIVEYYNARHPDPHDHDESDTDNGGMFRFEKDMTGSGH